VFLQRNVDGAGTDRLTFIDVVTGEAVPVEVIGERYTLLPDEVMYFDPTRNLVMTARTDGRSIPHAFIQLGSGARRVDWLVSADGVEIAWTLTQGAPESLTTITTVANLDGTNPRQVLTDGPRNGIRAMPVAFNKDHSVLYMDFQPDGFSEFTPYPQYAGLFALDLTSLEWQYLPDEPGCFCGAGLGNGLFLRLKVSTDLTGFDLNIYNLAAEVKQTVPAQPFRNFTQAGDIVVSPDGRLAVYALSAIQDFGRPNQSVATVFMLVDLETLTQQPLTDSITTFVEPLAWTEDNTAIIFTSRQRDGTWKINLSDRRLDRVADATYLGVVG
jgi:hypothetical protein